MLKNQSLAPSPPPMSWQKLGKIITPQPTIDWMATFTGPSFALQIEDSPLFDIYITGRDQLNRSQIGKIRIDIREPNQVLRIDPNPVLSFGELGAFDENGVAYPYIVRHQNQLYLYYVGWMPTVLTPFSNHIGLAIQQKNGAFQRASRAPILPRTHEDYLSTGSCGVRINQEGIWQMWYTSFVKWEKSNNQQKPKHYYHIKYASSTDGIHWQRNHEVCIDFNNEREFAICHPTVWRDSEGLYHMWFACRGEEYQIGYASSNDGIYWNRCDERAGISVSKEGWDNKALCYPHVFEYAGRLFMLYNGNEYGKTGLGLAIC